MYTKSLIQQTVEALNIKDNFRVALEQLMEKYNIEDSVFVFKNGTLYEAVEGYFSVENNFDNIAEAVSNCDFKTCGVRVINNTSFQVGKLNKTISECEKEKPIFDLYKLENINF